MNFSIIRFLDKRSYVFITVTFLAGYFHELLFLRRFFVELWMDCWNWPVKYTVYSKLCSSAVILIYYRKVIGYVGLHRKYKQKKDIHFCWSLLYFESSSVHQPCWWWTYWYWRKLIFYLLKKTRFNHSKYNLTIN